MYNETRAPLTLTGQDFDPEEITERLGQPTKSWRAGQPRPGRGDVYRFSAWRWSTAKEYRVELEDQIAKVLTRFYPLRDAVKELARQHRLSVEISCVVETYVDIAPEDHSELMGMLPGLNIPEEMVR